MAESVSILHMSIPPFNNDQGLDNKIMILWYNDNLVWYNDNLFNLLTGSPVQRDKERPVIQCLTFTINLYLFICIEHN